jgi:hypothetical protein
MCVRGSWWGSGKEIEQKEKRRKEHMGLQKKGAKKENKELSKIRRKECDRNVLTCL